MGQRFAAIFAAREEPDQRFFRARGPKAIKAIDDVMQQFMMTTDLRGAALAIVQGARLVYAKGYTYGEAAPTYPDILPETRFRQASISKIFAALALYRLMQTNPNVALNTTIQSILNLTQPDGSSPKDPRFNSITMGRISEAGLIFSVGRLGFNWSFLP